MNYKIIEDMETFKDNWLNIQNDPSYSLYAFQTYPWIRHWTNCFHPDESFVITFYDSSPSSPFLIIPLCVIKNKFSRKLTISGENISDYLSPIIKKDIIIDSHFIENTLLTVAKQKKCDCIEFSKIPSIIEDQKNPFLSFQGIKNEIADSWSLTLKDSYESILEDRFSKKHRYNLSRGEKKLRELGDFQFNFEKDSSNIIETTQRMIEQKEEKYLKTKVKNSFQIKKNRDFYLDIKNEMSQLKHVTSLKIDDKTISTHWGVTFRNRFYYLMPTYTFSDKKILKFSPGKTHLTYLIKWAIEKGFSTFDFTIGDESYKKDWCDKKLSLHKWFKPISIKGKIVYLIMEGERWIRNNHWLFSIARKIKQSYYDLINTKRNR